jgi:hypothetical protein
VNKWPDSPLIPLEWDWSDAWWLHANVMISEGYCPKHGQPLSGTGRCATCLGVTWELTSAAGTANATFLHPLPSWAVTDGDTVLVERLAEEGGGGAT